MTFNSKIDPQKNGHSLNKHRGFKRKNKGVPCLVFLRNHLNKLFMEDWFCSACSTMFDRSLVIFAVKVSISPRFFLYMYILYSGVQRATTFRNLQVGSSLWTLQYWNHADWNQQFGCCRPGSLLSSLRGNLPQIWSTKNHLVSRSFPKRSYPSNHVNIA